MSEKRRFDLFGGPKKEFNPDSVVNPILWASGIFIGTLMFVSMQHKDFLFPPQAEKKTHQEIKNVTNNHNLQEEIKEVREKIEK
jgi:hypothetical protein